MVLSLTLAPVHASRHANFIKQPMKRRRSFPIKIIRQLKYSFSALISMVFSPNHTRVYSWWVIALFFMGIAFIGYLVTKQ